MKHRGMSVMFSIDSKDFLWVSQLILSFQKIKNHDNSCELSHADRKEHTMCYLPHLRQDSA